MEAHIQFGDNIPDYPNHLTNEPAGRGTVGKTAVVGLKDRGTNKVLTGVVDSIDKATLHSFVEKRTGADTQTYKGLPNHEAGRQGVGEYVRGQVHTNGMESFWSMLKRGFTGTYHWM